jgi:hypothetical protein
MGNATKDVRRVMTVGGQPVLAGIACGLPKAARTERP